MKKVELLSPAGNFECFKAAIDNGANAVYLGGKNFSARAFADNFEYEELAEAVRYAHLRDVKVYVTVNTLLNENELNNALKSIDFYYQNNVDALLVQDLGLYYVLSKKYPDLELHCSTQMHVHNIEGIRTAKRLGFKRVVIPRESSLDFIKEACKNDIEIETFVHGAICVSYSGQCMMSSVTKKRSANKGMCAQCCRLRYELFDSENNRIRTDTDYLLSPKDMFLINDIPSLIEAGVSSFKIEGRMKSPAYVAYVTRMYRKAIDSYYEGKSFSLDEEEIDNLKALFNRNFTNDYLYGKDDLFSQRTPNHLGIEIGETLGYKDGKIIIRLKKKLNQFDGIRIDDEGCIVNMMYKDGLLVSGGEAGEIVSFVFPKNCHGKVYKTIDSVLEKNLKDTPGKKILINMEVSIMPEENVKVTILKDDVSFEYVSEICAQKAINAALSKEDIIKQFSKLNDTVYSIDRIDVTSDNAFLRVKDLNEIRRNAIEAFDEYRLKRFERKTPERAVEFVEPSIDDEKKMSLKDGRLFVDNTEYGIDYVINADSTYPEGNMALIEEFGGLLKEYDEKVAYFTLNCCNSYAYEFLKKLGFKQIILSCELSANEISLLCDAYSDRNGVIIKPYVLTEGRRTLMYLLSDPFRKYKGASLLKDGNDAFIIRKQGKITELVENSNRIELDLPENALSFKIED